MSLTGLNYGAAIGNAGRLAPTRGRIQGGFPGLAYPNPFFDVAHTYLPVSVKHLFRFCRYYALTNPVIATVISKLAEYPITDVFFDHDSKEIKEKWSDYFQDTLQYRKFMISVGLDMFTYGTALISPAFPFKKHLTCTKCGFTEPAEKSRDRWNFTNFEFRYTCPKCKEVAAAKVQDISYKSPSEFRLIKWEPEQVDITYNRFTGKTHYFYTVPQPMRNDVLMGKKEIVEDIPQAFIEAIKQNKAITLAPDKVFVLRRPSMSLPDNGWGMPLIFPVLKDAFYYQILRKATESMILEHAVPLRVIFPQPATGTADPFCVSPTTLVETADGVKPASEIRQDDFLRSHTGALRRVLGVIARDVREGEKVYKLRVTTLTAFPFEVSEEHPILAVKRTGKKRGYAAQVWTDPEFVQAKDLKPGDFVAYPVARSVASVSSVDLAEYVDRAATDKYVYRRLNQASAEIYEFLEECGTPDFAWGERKEHLEKMGWSLADYSNACAAFKEGSVDRMSRHLPLNEDLATVIGYYIAEGSNSNGLPAFAFCLATEGHVADKVAACAAALGFRGSSRRDVQSQNCIHLIVQDVILGEFLSNATGKYAANKRIPQFLAEAPLPVLRAGLFGLFDGDGCSIQTTTNRVALKTVSPHLASDVRRLLLSVGLIGCVSREVMGPNAIAAQDAFHVNYNGPQADAMRAFFRDGTLPQAVDARCGVIRNGYVLTRIEQMSEVPVPQVIGFQMAEDKSFCVVGVATHNTSINLADWRDHIGAELARFRMDNGYIPILPLPVGTQTIGGDGKGIFLTQEMAQLADHMIMYMGVPLEFVKGGTSFSGTNLSMRMVENFFLGYVIDQKNLLRFVIQEVGDFFGWPKPRGRFKPFKTTDDLQRLALLAQLNGQQKISDTTLLQILDMDQEAENELLIRETSKRLEATKKQQLAMAEIQGESQAIMMKFQVKAQAAAQQEASQPPAQGEPGGPPSTSPAAQEAQVAQGPQGNPTSPGDIAAPEDDKTRFDKMIGSNTPQVQAMARAQAQQILTADEQTQSVMLQNLQAQSPEYAKLVQGYMRELKAQQSMNEQSMVDARPMPEQRAPRRTTNGQGGG